MAPWISRIRTWPAFWIMFKSGSIIHDWMINDWIIHNWISRILTWPAFLDSDEIPTCQISLLAANSASIFQGELSLLEVMFPTLPKKSYYGEAEIFMNNTCVARIPDGIYTWFQKCQQGLIRLALDVTEYGSPIFHPETVQGIGSREGWEEFQSLHVVICHNDEKHNVNWVW